MPIAEAPSTEGKADIILTAGASQFKLAGPCGWATAMGAKYIGANDAKNKLKVFSTYFDIPNPPSVTTTYILTDNNEFKDPKYITMNISETAGMKLTEWKSTKTSGSLTLKVEGNKITADLSGITLSSTTSKGFYEDGNVGDFAKDGKLTGTLTFYK